MAVNYFWSNGNFFFLVNIYYSKDGRAKRMYRSGTTGPTNQNIKLIVFNIEKSYSIYSEIPLPSWPFLFFSFSLALPLFFFASKARVNIHIDCALCSQFFFQFLWVKCMQALIPPQPFTIITITILYSGYIFIDAT